MVAVTLLVAGCQKEKSFDGMLILAEGFNSSNTKLAVNGIVSTWADGDDVRINDQRATVSISESQAKVTLDAKTTSPFYGVYPADIYTSNTGADYTLTLPPSYTYATDGTYQLLATPMVGYTNDASVMEFKHVTAAITVEIKNDFGIDVKVTNITISSNKYQLSGPTTVTIGSSITVNPTVETENAALRQVQMTFGSTALNIASGSTAQVQVPVLPVDNDNRFTISVTVQNKDDADMEYTFSKTQADGSTYGYTLSRAQLGYAPAKFGGVFTVASGKQVRFAPGNLQYQASTGTWRFAKHQYDAIGNNAGNNVFDDTRSTQAAWIDLFGWGTSGWNGGYVTTTNYYQPYDYLGTGSSTYGYYYGPSTGSAWSPTTQNLTGDYASRDWGVYNAIFNGGNVKNRWRTLTGGSGAEWEYLMSTRSASTVSGISDARYLKAKVAGVNGYIVFPDEFVLPDGISITSSHININSYLAWSNVASNLSSSEWQKMEVAGAIFLPCTGYRSYSNNNPSFTDNAGYYWSSSVNNTANAYHIQLATTAPSFAASNAKRLGCSVRLVRDVQ